jgi:hypothetical protein
MRVLSEPGSTEGKLVTGKKEDLYHAQEVLNYILAALSQSRMLHLHNNDQGNTW